MVGAFMLAGIFLLLITSSPPAAAKKQQPFLDEAMTPLHQQALKDGMKLAQQYNENEKCVAMRRSKGLIDMVQAMAGNRSFNQLLVMKYTEKNSIQFHSANLTQPLRNKVIYVRNQKVASKMLYENSIVYAHDKGVRKRMTFNFLSDESEQTPPTKIMVSKKKMYKVDGLYFTFIRDPIDAFISGWLEIMFRSRDAYQDSLHAGNHTDDDGKADKTTIVPPPSSSQLNRTKPQAKPDSEIGIEIAPSLLMSRLNSSAVFKAFIDDVENHRYFEEGVHTWPQVYEIILY
jgi:hypothetical protein